MQYEQSSSGWTLSERVRCYCAVSEMCDLEVCVSQALLSNLEPYQAFLWKTIRLSILQIPALQFPVIQSLLCVSACASSDCWLSL